MAVVNTLFNLNSLPAETVDDVAELTKVFDKIYDSWNVSVPTTNAYLLNSEVATSFSEPDEDYFYFVNFIQQYISKTIPNERDLKTGSYWFFENERPFIVKETDGNGLIKYSLTQGRLYPYCPSYNGISPDNLRALYTRYNEYNNSYRFIKRYNAK